MATPAHALPAAPAPPVHALPIPWAAAEPTPLHVARDPASAAHPSSATEVDPDLLEELGDEIRTLAAHIHAANHRLLTLIARFDALGGWAPGGFRSCAHWLMFHTGLDLGAAREHVRVARALESLPETSASMARGELSFSKVRAITRIAEAENEPELVALARGVDTRRLERMVRGWRKGSRQDEAAREEERHRSRCVSVFPDDDGMYVIRGRLTPEVGALVMEAIAAAADALYQADPPAGQDSEAEAARLRADALGLVAERALGAGFGGRRSGSGVVGDVADADHVDDLADVPTSGSGAARYTTLLVEVAALREDAGDAEHARYSADTEATEDMGNTEDGEDATEAETADPPAYRAGHAPTRPDMPVSQNRVSAEIRVWDMRALTNGRTDGSRPIREPAIGSRPTCELADGTRLAHETARRLTCDCGTVRVTRAPGGEVLDVGRKTRTIPPALRRALEVRDRGCRFPGCGLPFTAGHHVRHWADGGPTSLANTLLLCRFHHRLVHEGGWRVTWWGQIPVFIDPTGGEHLDVQRRPPELRDPVGQIVARNEREGIQPDACTASARWRREQDIPDGVYFRAQEAVG